MGRRSSFVRWYDSCGNTVHYVALCLCQVAASDYWQRKGCPKNKLVIGLAGYGRTFTLPDPTKHGLNVVANVPGTRHHYTNESGVVSYYEVS